MELRLITVRLDPETGEFPDNPLCDLEGEVVSVVEHFFLHGDLPHLLLVVHLRPARPEQHKGPRPASPGPRDKLNPEEQTLYDRLVAWRRGSAQAAGIASYIVATNVQLAEVARLRPTSLTALRAISGFGDAKVRLHGAEVLAVVAASPPPKQEPASGA